LITTTRPYVAYAAGNGGAVSYFNGNAWVSVGFSGSLPGYLSMAISNDGILYIAYSDLSINRKITVKKYVPGANWTVVGVAGFSNNPIELPNIAVDGNGVPYVAYADIYVNAGIKVMKYDGNSWINVGNTGISLPDISTLNMVVGKSGVPYIIYTRMQFNNKGNVYKFDGTDWVNAGTPEFAAGKVGKPSLAVTSSGVIIVAYENMYAFAKSYAPFGDPLELEELKGEKTPEGTSRLTWDTQRKRHSLFSNRIFCKRAGLSKYRFSKCEERHRWCCKFCALSIYPYNAFKRY
jgi:hypothetical protein